MRGHCERVLASDHPADSHTIISYDHDVPDHLPGSPLCPVELKHKMKGQGICPLHGRRSEVVAARGRADAKRLGSLATARREPEIVFDSGVAEGDEHQGLGS
ncbi:hypothetical protein B0A48_12208 [Cryoendolithus antarcticus]|uniref:Uncharacterized protein n=1 Tax=Cryoendolithus antarcticus TaxID=1507870 RepID=A0A1V8SUD2_9PEZI|nr:hypothetical protein B0A48_12208 [Cryoendolithus antarcticus]